MKKQFLGSLFTLSCVLFSGCVGTPAVPFKDVVTTAPLLKVFEKTSVEEDFNTVDTGSLSQDAQRELNALTKDSKVEKRVLLELEKGDAFFRKGDMETAIACFSHAIRIDSNHVEAYYQRAIAYGKTGNVANEIADYGMVIQLDENHAEAHNRLGVSYANQGSADIAIIHFSEAIRINPEFVESSRCLRKQRPARQDDYRLDTGNQTKPRQSGCLF